MHRGLESLRMRTLLAMLVLSFVAVLSMAVHWPISPTHLQLQTDGGLGAGSNFGNRLTSNDGGRFALVNTNELGDWTMAIRCEGPQAVRYLFSTDGGVPTTSNQLLDFDSTVLVQVTHGNSDVFKFLALRTEDAGVPLCVVQKVK